MIPFCFVKRNLAKSQRRYFSFHVSMAAGKGMHSSSGQEIPELKAFLDCKRARTHAQSCNHNHPGLTWFARGPRAHTRAHTHSHRTGSKALRSTNRRRARPHTARGPLLQPLARAAPWRPSRAWAALPLRWLSPRATSPCRPSRASPSGQAARSGGRTWAHIGLQPGGRRGAAWGA